jgi:hypothetical protein
VAQSDDATEPCLPGRVDERRPLRAVRRGEHSLHRHLRRRAGPVDTSPVVSASGREWLDYRRVETSPVASGGGARARDVEELGVRDVVAGVGEGQADLRSQFGYPRECYLGPNTCFS